jgi:hypothetical protein
LHPDDLRPIYADEVIFRKSSFVRFKQYGEESMIMNKFWTAATAACLLTVSVMAQTSASGSASGNASAAVGAESSPGSLNPGTTLQAELTKSIDTKKVKTGDEVTAKLLQDVKDGNLVIHKGSKLVGHVTDAQIKTKENAQSKLGIIFDKAILKGGQEVAFKGVILSLAAPVEPSPSSLGGGNMDRNVGGGPSIGPVAMGSATRPSPAPVSSAGGTIRNPTDDSANNPANGPANGNSNAVASKVQASVITAADHNIKLDSGTQMVIQVIGPAAAH